MITMLFNRGIVAVESMMHLNMLNYPAIDNCRNIRVQNYIIVTKIIGKKMIKKYI